MNERIGIMGGSFDPIHLGHIEAAWAAYKYKKLSTVYFQPTGTPPHKQGLHASPQDRVAMASLALEGQDDWAKLSTMEVYRPHISFTVDTLMQLHRKFVDEDIFYIIGMDTLIDLPNWREIGKVCSLCEFIVVGREGTNSIPGFRVAQQLRQAFDAYIHFCPAVIRSVSSTMIRHALQERADTDQYLDARVRRYIDEHGLYLSPGASA